MWWLNWGWYLVKLLPFWDKSFPILMTPILTVIWHTDNSAWSNVLPSLTSTFLGTQVHHANAIRVCRMWCIVKVDPLYRHNNASNQWCMADSIFQHKTRIALFWQQDRYGKELPPLHHLTQLLALSLQVDGLIWIQVTAQTFKNGILASSLPRCLAIKELC